MGRSATPRIVGPTATEATDGYTGTIPAQMAELLGWPSLTFAKEVHLEGGTAKIQRQTVMPSSVVPPSRIVVSIGVSALPAPAKELGCTQATCDGSSRLSVMYR